VVSSFLIAALTNAVPPKDPGKTLNSYSPSSQIAQRKIDIGGILFALSTLLERQQFSAGSWHTA
jgi:hypothetical protein